MSDTHAQFDPFEDGFHDNPYPQYRRLREIEPVHRTALGPILLTRWEDVNRLLRSPAVSVEAANAADARRLQPSHGHPERDERGKQFILRLDPPDHTRLRRLVARAFTPRGVVGHRAVADLQHVSPGLVSRVATFVAGERADGEKSEP